MTQAQLREFKFTNDSAPIEYLPIVAEPTQVHTLKFFGASSSIQIKREDQTHSVYGGNKIRNLEFILAQARLKNISKLSTLVPFGSNFTAALTSQAKLNGFQVELNQFIAKRNNQIDSHELFCQKQNAFINNYEGVTAPLMAVARHTRTLLNNYYHQDTMIITPGGSNLFGAMGHAKAFIEFAEQQGLTSKNAPDYIVVGAGTCGTIAGLTAGISILNFNTKVIGVRCAEKIVTFPARILKIANSLLRHLGLEQRVSRANFNLVDLDISHRYGSQIPQAQNLIHDFYEKEGIALDTTYTSKVIHYLKTNLSENNFKGSDILYWHTYSDKAYNWTLDRDKKRSEIAKIEIEKGGGYAN